MVLPSPRPCLSRIVGAMLLPLIATAPLGVALAASLAPPLAGPVAALFPPWWDAAATLAAAGRAGAAIRFGAFSFVVIVASADRDGLRAAGAWLLLDPIAIGGCDRAASAAP